MVADAYPNFSICGIPYYISGDVTDWQNMAHRSIADLKATGMHLRLDHTALRIDVDAHTLTTTAGSGAESLLSYDARVVGTGATPIRPPIDGLNGAGALGDDDGVHLLHTMGDTFALSRTLQTAQAGRVVIVGAGYVGLEMTEAFIARGLHVTQIEQLPELLPTVDAELGALVRAELVAHGVDVTTSTTVTRISRAPPAGPADSRWTAPAATASPTSAKWTWSWSQSGSAPTPTCWSRPAPTPGHEAPSRWTNTCTPASPTCTGPGTASHPPPPPRHHLPAVGHHRPQAGHVARREHGGRPRPLRRQPGHPGSQGLRAGRSPNRPARTRSGRRRVYPGHQSEQPR